MTTQQLKCFTTLAANLNYARTAEALSLSQPAVSRQIQALETEVGARLFNRTTRSVSLTQVGAQFLPEAQQMLNMYYNSMDWIAHFHSERRNVLRIGYADTHCNRLISEILFSILPQNNNIIPDLVMDQTDANLHRLTTGQLDLVIGIEDSHFEDASVRFLLLHNDAFVCVINKKHPLAEKCRANHTDCVSSDDLWPQRQIIDIPPYLLRNTFSRGHRIVPVNDALDNIICSNISEAYSLALAGVGYALIPEHLIIPHPQLSFLHWAQSPQAPMGIYLRQEDAAPDGSALELFVRAAQEKYRKGDEALFPEDDASKTGFFDYSLESH